MKHLTISTLLLSSLPLLAQSNSNLPRADLQLSTVAGVHNNVANNNLDAGFTMFKVASPKQALSDRSGGLVATSRLMYVAYADLIGGNIVIQFRRSTDGGRNFEPAVTIYTCNTAGGEDLGTGGNELNLYCYADDVYMSLVTNRDDLVGGGQSVYVVGSNDQGQTWSAPVLATPGIGSTRYDVDEHRGAATSTGLHMTYEWDYAASATGNENFAYTRMGFTGGVFGVQLPSVDITTFADGTFDVDNPCVDAQDNVVHICWKDDSDPVMAGQNQVYSVTSFDGGATFSAPFNHTQFTAPLTWADARQPFACVDGLYAYTFMEDSRVDQDDVWMDRGDLDLNNNTVTWSQRGVMCSDIPNGPSNGSGLGDNDVDGFKVAVEGGVIAILYRDDRLAPTNSNYARLAVDRNGGNDFIANIGSHHLLNGLASTLYDVDVNRKVICAVWEQCSGQEEGGIALSHDAGLTVTASQFTTMGSCSTPSGVIDIDDVYCAVSLNGDYGLVYVDERLGNSNATNHCFYTGGKYPVLRSPLLVGGVIEMNKLDPSESSNYGFLMISGGGTIPGHAVAGNTDGFFVGLQNDIWFQLLFASAYTTFAGVSASGDATFTIPGGIPNLTALLGFPIDCAAGTVSFGPRLFVSYTDPLRF
ncbi:MAG: exo-alpha-sialidase [Planctomycetes bacterium]|nr:exo-alpha-sialidase [Planctomycetota bacterium]